MLQFSLPRVSVTINWLFFLLLAFLGSGAGFENLQSVPGLQKLVIFIIAGLISILVHELGHAYSGIGLGARYSNIELHTMGGHAEFPGANLSRPRWIFVTAMGPGASIALAVIFFLLKMLVVPPDLPYPSLHYFIQTMIVINIFWSIFNLLPILPLDGGQIVMHTLGPRRIKITCIISFITLAVAGFGLWQLTGSLYNLILILLLASYTFRVWQEAS